MTIRIVIADDQEDLEVVAECADGESAQLFPPDRAVLQSPLLDAAVAAVSWSTR